MDRDLVVRLGRCILLQRNMPCTVHWLNTMPPETTNHWIKHAIKPWVCFYLKDEVFGTSWQHGSLSGEHCVERHVQTTSYPSANVAAQNILIFGLRLRFGTLWGLRLRFPSCLLCLGLGFGLPRRGSLGGRARWFHGPYFESQPMGQPTDGTTH